MEYPVAKFCPKKKCKIFQCPTAFMFPVIDKLFDGISDAVNVKELFLVLNCSSYLSTTYPYFMFFSKFSNIQKAYLEIYSDNNPLFMNDDVFNLVKKS